MKIILRTSLPIVGASITDMQKGLEIQSTNLRDLLDELCSKYQVNLVDPATGDVHEDIVLLLNGVRHAALPEGLETTLKGGDEVGLVYGLAAGG